MKPLLILPLIIPLISAALALLFWGKAKIQRGISLSGATLHLIASVFLLTSIWQNDIQAVQIGNWPAPFGITLVADLLSGIMLTMTGVMGLAVAIYSLASIDSGRELYGYHPLYHILLMGISGSFLTGDIFNLYVWFEVMLIASFVLLALGGERPQLEGALKYMALNLLSSAIFLAAIGLLYGTIGSLNMADVAVKVAENQEAQGMLTSIAILFMVAFGLKAGVFPLFAWLPASYHTPPVPVSAIFGGLLTKVGVYTLLRFFTLIFVQDVAYTHTILLIIAGLTMLVGILGALIQTEIRRILAFNLISHIGFMVMGLGLFTPLALAGAIFYLIHDMTVKTNLFMLSGVIGRLRGTEYLPKLGGLYKSAPGVAILFLIPALALSGIPPLSGFWPKLALIQAGLEGEQYLMVAAAITASFLTLYSMTQIWSQAFWTPAPEPSTAPPNGQLRWPLVVPIILLAGLTLSLGFWANPVFNLSMRAAEQLINPQLYINTVLGG